MFKNNKFGKSWGWAFLFAFLAYVVTGGAIAKATNGTSNSATKKGSLMKKWFVVLSTLLVIAFAAFMVVNNIVRFPTAEAKSESLSAYVAPLHTGNTITTLRFGDCMGDKGSDAVYQGIGGSQASGDLYNTPNTWCDNGAPAVQPTMVEKIKKAIETVISTLTVEPPITQETQLPPTTPTPPTPGVTQTELPPTTEVTSTPDITNTPDPTEEVTSTPEPPTNTPEPPATEKPCDKGNPGNTKCVGNAGEDPNGKGTMPNDNAGGNGNGATGNQGEGGNGNGNNGNGNGNNH